jgi:transcriptional regulator with XRE-family HTH domain
MAQDTNAGLMLSHRLRTLRLTSFGKRVTQRQLAVALGVSPPLVCSWEHRETPKAPPEEHLNAYARFFASPRSLGDGHPRLPELHELTEQEAEGHRTILAELHRLRAAATGRSTTSAEVADPFRNHLRAEAGSGLWRFPAGEVITIVSARLPDKMLNKLPASDRFDPDYVESYRYADLDSVIELFGHIRAVNPDNEVNIRIADQLVDDDRKTHVVVLGGIDWNAMTREMFKLTKVPVTQIGRHVTADRGGFVVLNPDGEPAGRFEPVFDGELIREDVGHFVRAPNPYRTDRSLTICNASYSRGVVGVVRALTGARFRDKNAGFFANLLPQSGTTSILFRVSMLAGAVTVPDLSSAKEVLHSWTSSPKPPARRHSDGT